MKNALLAIALATLTPALAHAQSATPSITFRGFADAGATTFTANQSFNAVLGRASGAVFGGGIELGLAQHWFVSLAASRFRRTGHRVFVFEGDVSDLDLSETISVTPLEATVGYRFGSLDRISPYAGGGVGWHRYSEKSPMADKGDDVARTFTGYHALGGVEFPVRRWIAAAAEAQWSAVPNALGEAGSSVSRVYDEHDLGGFTIRAKLVIGR